MLVAGSEVREKMLSLAEETRRLWAVRMLQIYFKLFKSAKGRRDAEALQKEYAMLKAMEAGRQHALDAKHGVDSTQLGALISDAVTDKAVEEETLRRRAPANGAAANGHNGDMNGGAP